MRLLRLRLSDKDRETYGGPEWTQIDLDAIADLSYAELLQLERDMHRHDRMSIAQLLAVQWPDKTALGLRGMLWLSRQLAGETKPAWPDFKPQQPLRADYQYVLDAEPDDADPPDGGSSEPPSVKAARSKKG